MNPEMIKRIAREAGMVEGPWANGNKERIWQENREFPDALEMFASLIAKECVSVIQQRHKLALEHEWDVEDTLADIKEQITEKFHCEKDF
jgi:hypothetical protein